jgi:hypothetical protein
MFKTQLDLDGYVFCSNPCCLGKFLMNVFGNSLRDETAAVPYLISWNLTVLAASRSGRSDIGCREVFGLL